MISGSVNAEPEAILELSVLDDRERRHAIQGVVDTGYNLYLTLPLNLIEKWRLQWRRRSPGLLADGSEVWLDTFTAMVLWDGKTRRIEVDAADGDPLIGMWLLKGFDLHVTVKAGGRVAVQRTPPSRPQRRNR